MRVRDYVRRYATVTRFIVGDENDPDSLVLFRWERCDENCNVAVFSEGQSGFLNGESARRHAAGRGFEVIQKPKKL